MASDNANDVKGNYTRMVGALTDFLAYSFRNAQSPYFAPVNYVWGEGILAGLYYALVYPKSARKVVEQLRGAPEVFGGMFGPEYVDKLAATLAPLLEGKVSEDALMDKWAELAKKYREDAGL